MKTSSLKIVMEIGKGEMRIHRISARLSAFRSFDQEGSHPRRSALDCVSQINELLLADTGRFYHRYLYHNRDRHRQKSTYEIEKQRDLGNLFDFEISGTRGQSYQALIR
jgi:hypothetical protein